MTAPPFAGASRVVCVGETMAVLAPTSSVSLEFAEECMLGIGGAESNVAAQLAELGLTAVWAGRVGSDPFGQRVLRVLSERGVDVSLAEVDASAPTAVYFKEPDTGTGARTLYYRAGSAASLMGPEAIRRWSLDSAPWVHISGITAALSATCRALLEAVLDQRAAAGLPTSFDVNYRPALWAPAEAGPVLLELASRATVVLVGLDEAQTLWGCMTVEDVAEVLPEPGHLVVKDGAVEAIEYVRPSGGPRAAYRVPARQVDVVEPVGAGDAFAAGFLAGFICGTHPADRLSLGHALAAWTLGGRGDFRPGHGLTAPGPARSGAS
ncbi:sugar kinase [Sinomonas sp. P10A9]|uniref:Sugar kinase n=1 Tax=Sinomonas puerhi TaxID=3238584 RepID=A0AB39L4G1_9MICC